MLPERPAKAFFHLEGTSPATNDIVRSLTPDPRGVLIPKFSRGRRDSWGEGVNAFSPHPTNPKLIPGANRYPTRKIDLHHLLAVHRRAGFVGQGRDDLAGGNIDHLAG